MGIIKVCQKVLLAFPLLTQPSVVALSETLENQLAPSVVLHSKASKLFDRYGHNAPKPVRKKISSMLREHMLFRERLENYAPSLNELYVKKAIKSLRSREQRVVRMFHSQNGPAIVNKLELNLRKDTLEASIEARRARLEERVDGAALQAATGISPVEKEYYSLFDLIDGLFKGQVPPEAIGVSAKIFQDGRVHAGRYHVAFQPPCECWALERRKVKEATREAALALSAPPLVHTWLDTIFRSTSSETTLPSLGFGVSKEDEAAKLYVLNQHDQPLPELPLVASGATSQFLSVDDVMPTVTSIPSKNKSRKVHRVPDRMLSLEWKLGSDAVRIRQYAKLTDEASRLMSLTQDNADLSEKIRNLMTEFGGASEDVSVTSAFVPEDLEAKLNVKGDTGTKADLYPAVSQSASKFGIKLSPKALHSVSSDAELLEKHLSPVLGATGMSASPTVMRALKQWYSASSVVKHPLTNFQFGDGFVTFYRHPGSFGALDPDEPSHFDAMKRGLAKKEPQPPPVLAVLRELGSQTGPRDDDDHPQSECEEAQQTYMEKSLWGDGTKCDTELEDTDPGVCPEDCKEDINELINACDNCEEVSYVCDSEVALSELDEGANLEAVTLVFETNAYFKVEKKGGVTESWGSRPFYDETSQQEDFMNIMEEAFREDRNEDFDEPTVELDTWEPVALNSENINITILPFKVVAKPGALDGETIEDFKAAVTSILIDTYAADLVDCSNSKWKCEMMVDESNLAAQCDDSSACNVTTTASWTEIPLHLVPNDRKWMAPYGGMGLNEEVGLWANTYCKYPFYGFFPGNDVMCAECTSASEAAENLVIWKGPCDIPELSDDGIDDPSELPYPDGYPDECGCDCAQLLLDVENMCEEGECMNKDFVYGGPNIKCNGATCPEEFDEDNHDPSEMAMWSDGVAACTGGYDDQSLWSDTPGDVTIDDASECWEATATAVLSNTWVAVSVTFDMEANAEPSTADKLTLKASTAAELGVEESAFTDFDVTHKEVSGDRKRRSLLDTTYLWTVAFDLTVRLENTDASTTTEFEDMIVDTISSDEYETRLQDDLGIEVTVEASSISFTASDIGSKEKDDDDNSGVIPGVDQASGYVIISAGAVVILAASIIGAICYKQKRNPFTSPEAPTTETNLELTARFGTNMDTPAQTSPKGVRVASF